MYNDVDENGNSVSYDLRPLVSPTTYVFKAKIGSFHYRYHGQQYDYLINVCDDVHPDAKHKSCEEHPHSPAYQVTAPPPKPVQTTKAAGKYTPPPPPPYKPACFRLADSGKVKFEFLNGSDPTEGLKVMYRGGQKCRKRNTPEVIKKTNETWKDIERQVELHLMCDPEMGQSTTDMINSGATVMVEEKPPPHECEYAIKWQTPHACPVGTSLGSSAQGGAAGGWLWFLVKWASILFAIAMGGVIVLCFNAVRTRVAQYRRGDFGFMEFFGMLMGDVQVKMQILLSGESSSGLPTQQRRSHMHDV